MADTDPRQKVQLSPPMEGLVGFAIGAIVGGALVLAGLISPIGMIGVAAGVGVGSWFNAWRRAKKASGGS